MITPRKQEALNKLKDKIVFRLTSSQGFTGVVAEELATQITQRIGRFTLGNMSAWQQVGPFKTTGRGSLSDLIYSLGRSSFGIKKDDVKRLVKNLNQGHAIRELIAFLEQKGRLKNIKRITELESLFTTIPNSPQKVKSILNKDIQEQTTKKTKLSIKQMKGKLEAIALGGLLASAVLTPITQLNLFAVDNEAIVGILPLGGFGINSPCSVQLIEVAHSNKIVKFRAVGSIFLAHQVGGKDSVKITGKLTGPMRTFFLGALWLLSLVSTGYMEGFDLQDANVTPVNYTTDPSVFRTDKTPPTSLAQINGITVEQPSYVKHFTFPVVTSHEIITKCYIETFSFEETLEGGKDVINYDLLLRTYEEPEEFISDVSKGLFKAVSRTNSEHLMKFFINAAYRTLKYVKEQYLSLDTDKWKMESYYNVDAVDIGFAFAMSLVGRL